MAKSSLEGVEAVQKMRASGERERISWMAAMETLDADIGNDISLCYIICICREVIIPAA